MTRKIINQKHHSHIEENTEVKIMLYIGILCALTKI